MHQVFCPLKRISFPYRTCVSSRVFTLYIYHYTLYITPYILYISLHYILPTVHFLESEMCKQHKNQVFAGSNSLAFCKLSSQFVISQLKSSIKLFPRSYHWHFLLLYIFMNMSTKCVKCISKLPQSSSALQNPSAAASNLFYWT